MLNKNYKIITIIAIALLILSGCSEKENKEHIIGSLLALTGQHKSFGITQKQGMDIALDEINQLGGINGVPLKIKYADTALEDDKGLQEYKRLTLEQNIRAIVGVTGSGIALKLAPMAEKDQVLLLSSLDTSPRLTKEGGAYFFRNIASDSYNGKVLSELVKKRGGSSTALIYNSENSWALGCRQAITDAVISDNDQSFVMDPVAVLDSTDNFSTAILTLKQQKEIDSVYVCLMGRQAGLFVKQAVNNGMTMQYYGTDAFSQQEFIDNAGNSAEKAFFVMPASSKSDTYTKFTEKYHKLYSQQADTIAAKAYDAVKIIAEAIKQTGNTDGASLRNVLKSISVHGITGENTFDGNGDLRHADFDQFTYSGTEMVKLDQ